MEAMRKLPHANGVPALVLGGPSHTTLGVIRALAAAGLPQRTIGARSSFVARSRWYRGLPAGLTEPQPGNLSEWLSACPLDQAVLVPCADDWVAAVAHLDPSLAARFPASQAPPDAVDVCLDKGRFAEVLAGLGIPHPKTVCLHADDDVLALSRQLDGAFVKPRDSLPFRAHFGVKAYQVVATSDAAARIREARQAGFELMLQEFIPGPPTAHCLVDGFVDRDGQVRAWFARRRVRTHPEPFGDSSCMKTIRPNEASVPIGVLARLLPALRYRGVFSAEFKRDQRDGLFKLIEINPRAWGGVSLPVACGVNLIEMAWRDALGLPVGTVETYPADRHWVYATRDAVACWRLFRDGRLSAREWTGTWRGAVQPVIRWDDPLPGLAEILTVVANARRRRAGAAP
jgi:predicted ATP-grasp superfamily ATP-dependent carboligase